MDLERLNAAFGSWNCAAALTELGCIAQEFGIGRLSNQGAGPETSHRNRARLTQ